MAPRFHLLFLMLINGTKEQDGLGSRLSCVAGEMERPSSDLTQAAKNKGIWDCLKFVYGLRITSAKSRSVRGASHQTISQM